MRTLTTADKRGLAHAIGNLRGPVLAAAAVAVLGACGGGEEAGDAGPQADADGWVTLTNGEDMSGWNTVGDGNWRVEEGAITADDSSAASFIVSEQNYTNFELELEFWVDTEANSGVFFRCEDPATITDTSCYEVNIYDTRPDQTYRTGSIVNVAEPAQFIYTGGQWNRYAIRAEGNHLQVTLNDQQMVDVEDDTHPQAGPIALQRGAGTVRFRNVRIREL